MCYAKAKDKLKSGEWEEALVMLHEGITNKRTKYNANLLENILTLMIDICVQNLTTAYLKDDIGQFRNYCQHNNLLLLEKMLKYLRNESEKVYLQLETEFGQKELQSFFTEENEGVTMVNKFEMATDDYLLMAYTHMDTYEKKSKVIPRINFFIDTFKNILDTLRSNHKLLQFYNDSARKVFKFCEKYKNKKEYRKISDTLHSHFNQILKYDK